MEDRTDNIEEGLKDLRGKGKKTQKTNLSRCVSILVKLKFIPVKKKMIRDPTFHFFSLETFSCFLLYYVSSVSLFSFAFLFFRASMNTKKSNTLESLELTDFLSYFGFNYTTFFLFPLLPIIIGSAAGNVTDISLCTSLPWPRIGIKIILCEFFTAFGYALSIIPTMFHYASDSFKENCLFIVLSIMCLCLACIMVAFCVTISQFIIFSWMDKLASIADDIDTDLHMQSLVLNNTPISIKH